MVWSALGWLDTFTMTISVCNSWKPQAGKRAWVHLMPYWQWLGDKWCESFKGSSFKQPNVAVQPVDILLCQKAPISSLFLFDVEKQHSQNKITQAEINLHSLTQTQTVLLKTLHTNSALLFFAKHALLSHTLCTHYVTQEVSQWNRKWPVRVFFLVFFALLYFFCSPFTESEAD